MGLFLPYKKMWDMPLGGTSTEKQVPHFFGNFAYVIVGGIFKICFRYRVDGRENLRCLRNKTGIMVVADHTSFLDVVFIYLAARTKQWVRLMGRDSLFPNGHGFVGQVLSRVGGFPIKRDTADRTAVKRATRMLKNNEIVGVFPEGTRRGKGTKTPEMHSGAALIAKMGHAPIVPMTIRNDELVKQKGKFLRFPKITIEYDKPILIEDFDFLPKDERLDACMWYAMRQCFALSKQIEPHEVNMAELFPLSNDYSEIFEKNPIPQHSAESIVAMKEKGK